MSKLKFTFWQKTIINWILIFITNWNFDLLNYSINILTTKIFLKQFLTRRFFTNLTFFFFVKKKPQTTSHVLKLSKKSTVLQHLKVF